MAKWITVARILIAAAESGQDLYQLRLWNAIKSRSCGDWLNWNLCDFLASVHTWAGHLLMQVERSVECFACVSVCELCVILWEEQSSHWCFPQINAIRMDGNCEAEPFRMGTCFQDNLIMHKSQSFSLTKYWLAATIMLHVEVQILAAAKYFLRK